ncbi:MAG: carboxymuconolactone decarboxylase family protein [Candidatus Thermoplasmatota archaeon]|jgi:AhpD family alkylhydroperoxidase|nr:carboxymuconolactone decarboxylase family protein [Candidatus Thermoplasmatota archaeon]
MEPRLNYSKYGKEMLSSLTSLEKSISSSGLNPVLLNLVKMRASQLNGCGWCLDMHSKEALLEGESLQRIVLLSAWWESPQFTNKEKAALAWTERVTLISDSREDNDIFENLKKHFSTQQIVALTWAILAINSWNRLNVAFKAIPGTYEPKQRKE